MADSTVDALELAGAPAASEVDFAGSAAEAREIKSMNAAADVTNREARMLWPPPDQNVQDPAYEQPGRGFQRSAVPPPWAPAGVRGNPRTCRSVHSHGRRAKGRRPSEGAGMLEIRSLTK